MKELKCPFCNKTLQPTLRKPDEYWCENYDCPQTNITWVGTSSLWKAFADTKKKLDSAIEFIESLRSNEDTPFWWVERVNRFFNKIKDNDKDVK